MGLTKTEIFTEEQNQLAVMLKALRILLVLPSLNISSKRMPAFAVIW